MFTMVYDTKNRGRAAGKSARSAGAERERGGTIFGPLDTRRVEVGKIFGPLLER